LAAWPSKTAFFGWTWKTAGGKKRDKANKDPIKILGFIPISSEKSQSLLY
jgi:hypothetical protein